MLFRSSDGFVEIGAGKLGKAVEQGGHPQVLLCVAFGGEVMDISNLYEPWSFGRFGGVDLAFLIIPSGDVAGQLVIPSAGFGGREAEDKPVAFAERVQQIRSVPGRTEFAAKRGLCRVILRGQFEGQIAGGPFGDGGATLLGVWLRADCARRGHKQNAETRRE